MKQSFPQYHLERRCLASTLKLKVWAVSRVNCSLHVQEGKALHIQKAERVTEGSIAKALYSKTSNDFPAVMCFLAENENQSTQGFARNLGQRGNAPAHIGTLFPCVPRLQKKRLLARRT